MVKTLASQQEYDCYRGEPGTPPTEPDSGEVTREIIGVVAKVLDENLDDGLEVDVGNGVVYAGEVVAHWLRSQAQESTDD